ncbi:hypothetical protein HK101_007989 [Irineochytrium annulatum]|nr:hypothetical protein HK101_007989 [Irineochytrium annulatum]
MGGHSFSDTARLSRADLDRIATQVTAVLTSLGLDTRQPPELSDKTSFGDIDLLAALPPNATANATLHQDIITRICSALGVPESTHHVRSGDQHSFLTRERHQVDVALVRDPSLLDLHAATLGNGDFVQILQRSQLRRLGLLLSVHGLFLRRDAPQADGMTLTRADALFRLSIDPARIAAFLGLPERALDGRTALSQQEVFECLRAARFYNWAEAAEWGRSDVAEDQRRRVRRPLVEAFLSSVLAESGGVGDAKEAPTAEIVQADALAFFGMEDAYREYEDRLRRIAEEAELRARSKGMLNGEILMRMFPTLKGKQVGTLKSLITERYGPDLPTLCRWLEETDESEKARAFAVLAQGVVSNEESR